MRVDRNGLSALCLFSLSLALLSAWEEIFFFNSLISYDVGFSSHLVYFASKAAILLLFALFSQQTTRFFMKSSSCFLGIAMILFSTASLSYATLYGPEAAPLAVIIGDISGAVSFVLFFALWFSQCRWFGPMFILGSYMTSSLAAAFILSFCSSLPIAGVLIAAGIFAIGSAGLALVAFRIMLQKIASNTSCEIESKEQSFPGMLWRILVFVGAQRLVFAFNEASLSVVVFGTGSYSSIGYLIVAIVIILCVMLSWRKATLIALVRFVMPILGIIFLVLPRNSVGAATVSGIFASGFCAAVDSIVILLLAMMCHCVKLSHEWVRKFGFVFGVAYLCVAAGEATFLLMPSYEMFEGVFGVVATVVAIALVIALPDSSLVATWFLALQTFDHAETDTAVETSTGLRAIVDYHGLARQYGLTLREEEIFELIASGKTSEEISEQLVVSGETVRTHRRHIYAKFGVHTEDELKALAHK